MLTFFSEKGKEVGVCLSRWVPTVAASFCSSGLSKEGNRQRGSACFQMDRCGCSGLPLTKGVHAHASPSKTHNFSIGTPGITI